MNKALIPQKSSVIMGFIWMSSLKNNRYDACSAGVKPMHNTDKNAVKTNGTVATNAAKKLGIIKQTTHHRVRRYTKMRSTLYDINMKRIGD